MCAQFSVHHVSRIQVTANSGIADGQCFHWQELTMFDANDNEVGMVVLFLDRTEAALPLGNVPPYWGMDLRQPALMMDGESPF